MKKETAKKTADEGPRLPYTNDDFETVVDAFPVGARLLVEQVVDTNSVRVIVPEGARDTSLQFRVVSKGADCTLEEIGEGDFVLLGRHAFMHMGLRGTRSSWCLAFEQDVLAVIKRKEGVDG